MHISRQFGLCYQNDVSNEKLPVFKWSQITLKSLRLENLTTYLIASGAVSYAMFICIGGFLHVRITPIVSLNLFVVR